MSSGWEHGKAVFQTNRLTDKWFKLWLGPGKKSNETRCRLCQNSTMLEKNGLVPYTLIYKGKNTRE